VDRTVIGSNRQGEPPLQFAQGQGRLVFGIVFTALVGIGECRSRQFVMDHLHGRPDDPLHDAAVVRQIGWAIRQADAMLVATTAQGLAFKLGRIVQVELQGLAAHRPVHIRPQPFQPGALVADGMCKAKAYRHRRRRFQRHHHPHHAARTHINGQGKEGSANRLSITLVHHDQVNHGVVDLNLFKRHGHGWWRSADTLQLAGRFPTSPPAAALSGSRAAIRNATVFRAGAGSCCALQACATLRWSAARLRF